MKPDSLNFQMKPVVSKLTPSILNATSIGGVNFCLSGFMQPSWLHLGLKESTKLLFWLMVGP